MKLPEIILLISAIAVVILLAYLVLRKMMAVGIADKILRGNRNDRHFLYHLIEKRFGSKRLLCGISLLVGNTQNALKRYTTSELLFVNNCGLFVIKSLPGNGLINVRRDDINWTYVNGEASKPFINPFEQNEQFIRVLKGLFKYEKLPNIPIYNIVVFTGKHVKFSQKMNGLMTADTIIPYLCGMDKNRFLRRKEKDTLIRLLKKHGHVSEIIN